MVEENKKEEVEEREYWGFEIWYKGERIQEWKNLLGNPTTQSKYSKDYYVLLLEDGTIKFIPAKINRDDYFYSLTHQSKRF